MLLGVIPIIKRSALTYICEEEDLPVVVVDAWTPELINQQNLTRWRKRFAPYITDPEKRRATLEKLTLDYWWKKISGPVQKTQNIKGTTAIKHSGQKEFKKNRPSSKHRKEASKPPTPGSSTVSGSEGSSDRDAAATSSGGVSDSLDGGNAVKSRSVVFPPGFQ